LNTYIWICIGI